jgi:hypothetical protein
MTQNVASSTSQTQWDSIADGTLYIAPTNGDIKYKSKGSAPKAWTRFLPGNLFIDQDITGNFLKDKTVTEIKMADSSVSTRSIINRNVTSPKIALGAILTEHFQENSLDGKVIKDNTLNGNKLINLSLEGIKLKDRTIDGVKLKQLTITDAELASNSVITRVIKDLNVTESKLANDSVSTRTIKDLNVTTPKLADLSVTNPKIGEKAVDWKNVNDDAIRTSHILNLNVTEPKLANNAVITRVIKDLSVTTPKLANDAVTTLKILNKNVTLAKLEDSVQSVIRNAVVHDGDYATVNANLRVKGNIVADPNNLTKTISGFKVYNPLFADYAEGFVVTEPVEEGHIVEIDKYGCVKKAEAYSRKIVGIVSERYGMCLDADEEDIKSGAKTAVGLIGKVPVQVVGKVSAGDFIISSGDGIGMATKKHFVGSIVGKALEDKDTYGLGSVLCLIQPM